MGALVVGRGPRRVTELEDAGDGEPQVGVGELQTGRGAVPDAVHPRPGEAVGLELGDDARERGAEPRLDGVPPLVGQHHGDRVAPEVVLQPGEEELVVEGDEVLVGAVEGVVLDLRVAGAPLAAAARHALGLGPHRPHAALQGFVRRAAGDGGVGGAPERVEIQDHLGHEGVVGLLGAGAGHLHGRGVGDRLRHGRGREGRRGRRGGGRAGPAVRPSPSPRSRVSPPSDPPRRGRPASSRPRPGPTRRARPRSDDASLQATALPPASPGPRGCHAHRPAPALERLRRGW